MAPLLPAQDTTRACEPAKNPRRLPAVNAVLDSARAIRAITFPDTTPLLLHALLTLQFDERGEVRRMAVFDRDVGADTAMVLGERLAPLVRKQRAADPWAVRLRVRLTPSPVLTIERSAYCPPVFDARPISPGGPRRTSTRLGPGGERAALWIYVNEEGLVTNAQFRGAALSGGIEAAIVQSAQRDRYRPALLDGFPTAIWVEQSVTVRTVVRPVR